MLLDKKPNEVLDSFLSEYSKVQEIDIDKAKRIIKEGRVYYKRGNTPDMEFKYQGSLEQAWYLALNNGKVDYSIYDDDYYFTDLWNCWVLFSRQYLRDIRNCFILPENTPIPFLFTNIKVVVDLGCGIGYTTRALKEMFPEAVVYGTNLEITKQYNFCKSMGLEYGFNVIPDISKIEQNIDIIFASEYFEHIQSPIEHLQDIILKKTPRYFILANSFNTKGAGHFTTYTEYGLDISEKDISKVFNDILRYHNYKKMKTNVWNNKPSIWVKYDDALPRFF